MVERRGKQGALRRSLLGQVSVSPQGFPSEKNCCGAGGFRASARCSQGNYLLRPRGCPGETHGRLRAGPGWHARPPMARGPDNRQGAADSHRLIHPMTVQNRPGARAHITPAGLMFLAITSVGWGFNWPVTKYLLGELPPLILRGTTGVVGARAAGRARRAPRPEPARAARIVAAAGAGRRSSTSPAGWC